MNNILNDLSYCDALERYNNKSIVKLFNEAVGILWRQGTIHDNVLLFINDAAPDIPKSGQALSVVYPKMIHFTCVACAFHCAAAMVRRNYPKVYFC